jgi:hypothetical protein
MIFRDARRDEVARIVALLADDELGAGRETGTSDKRRADAIRFYESLGFEASHEGLKLPL